MHTGGRSISKRNRSQIPGGPQHRDQDTAPVVHGELATGSRQNGKCRIGFPSWLLISKLSSPLRLPEHLVLWPCSPNQSFHFTTGTVSKVPGSQSPPGNSSGHRPHLNCKLYIMQNCVLLSTLLEFSHVQDGPAARSAAAPAQGCCARSWPHAAAPASPPPSLAELSLGPRQA